MPEARRRPPASPKAIVLFLADEEAAGVAVSTIELRLAAITAAHKRAGFGTGPTRSEPVRLTMRAIRRKRGNLKHHVAPLRAVQPRQGRRQHDRGTKAAPGATLLTWVRAVTVLTGLVEPHHTGGVWLVSDGTFRCRTE